MSSENIEIGPEFDPTHVEHEPSDELLELQQLSIKAALEAARIVKQGYKGVPLERLGLEFKADESHKTVTDVLADAAAVEIIRKGRPDIEIVAEESGYHAQIPALREQKLVAGGIQRIPRIRAFIDSLDGSRPFTQKKPESTIGISMWDAEGTQYYTGAIVHPGRGQLMYATLGRGTYIADLDEDFNAVGDRRLVKVYNKPSLWDATIAVDTWMNENTIHRLSRFYESVLPLAHKGGARNRFHIDGYGSNIAYEFDVARGSESGTALGLTTYVGGPWDWRSGFPAILEAGGIMVDVETGMMPTNTSKAVIYGNPRYVSLVMPSVIDMFRDYPGAA